jgi:hypothetical protein
MPERERLRYTGPDTDVGEFVTLLDARVPRRGTARVRTNFGYERELPVGDLAKLDKEDRESSFKFERSPD